MSSTSLHDANVDSEKALPGIPVLAGESSTSSRENGLWPFNKTRDWTKQKKMRVLSIIAALLAVLVIVVAVPVSVVKKKHENLDTGLISGTQNTDPTNALQAFPSIDSSASAILNVKIGTSPVGRNLSSTFAGLSYEKTRLSTGLFSGSNTALIALFRALGPSNLRIGGNSAETRSWNTTAPGQTSPYVSPKDIDDLAAFAEATGWRVIYGIKIANNTAAIAADEAAYVSQALGSKLYGFELGNEPNAYAITHQGSAPRVNETRVGDWDVEAFMNGYRDFVGWNRVAAAIKARVPNVMLTGPAATGDSASTWAVPFAAAEGNNISLLTHHYYRGKSNESYSTAATLLGDDPWLNRNGPLLRRAASDLPEGVRFAESNSYSGGGQVGVSNTFASTLWSIKYLFNLVQEGFSGSDFHGGGNRAQYSAITDDGNRTVTGTRPLYYGLLAFQQVARGQMLSTDRYTGNASGRGGYAFITREDENTFRAVVMNTNATTPIRYNLDWPYSMQGMTGRAMLLSGPAIDATDGITLGGATMPLDGSWSPKTWYSVGVRDSRTRVALPPYSAAILEFRRS